MNSTGFSFICLTPWLNLTQQFKAKIIFQLGRLTRIGPFLSWQNIITAFIESWIVGTDCVFFGISQSFFSAENAAAWLLSGAKKTHRITSLLAFMDFRFSLRFWGLRFNCLFFKALNRPTLSDTADMVWIWSCSSSVLVETESSLAFVVIVSMFWKNLLVNLRHPSSMNCISLLKIRAQYKPLFTSYIHVCICVSDVCRDNWGKKKLRTREQSFIPTQATLFFLGFCSFWKTDFVQNCSVNQPNSKVEAIKLRQQ